MKKLIATLLFTTASCSCFCQTTDTSKIKRSSFSTYDELKQKLSIAGVDKLTYLDSTFNFKVDIPEWLNLKETGTVYAFGGYPTDQPTIVPVIYASFAEAVVRYCW